MRAVAFILWAPVLALTLSACGGDDDKGGPVDSLCSADEQRCYGNALLTCADEGKAWNVGWCGESKTCTSDAGKPGCAGVKCERGARTCDDTKVLACPADGLSEATQVESCKTGHHCIFGTCVKTTCDDGTKACGWKAVLSCEGGSWKTTKCKSGERCDDASHTCVAQACKPTSLKCASESARATCNTDGSAWVEKGCASGEICTEGVCHPKVKGAEQDQDAGTVTADTGGGSDGGGFIDVGTSEDVQLEQFDILTLTLSETPTPGPGARKIEFKFSSAGFSSATKMVQITGDEGLDKLEIQLAPVEEFTTGTFTALEAQAEDTAILMNDGSNDQTQVQWQFQAVDYTLNLTAFDDVGGRLKGTLSAKLGDAINKGKFLYIEGAFDIKRSN